MASGILLGQVVAINFPSLVSNFNGRPERLEAGSRGILLWDVRARSSRAKPDANLHKFSFHNLVNQGDLGRSYITSRASNPQK